METRNFIFDDPGSIIVRIEGIESSTILSDQSVTVSGNVEQKVLRSVDFTTVVYDNTEKTTHEAYHIKPAQRLEFYYELAIILILIPAVLFVYVLFWIKKKPKESGSKYGSVKI